VTGACVTGAFVVGACVGACVTDTVHLTNNVRGNVGSGDGAIVFPAACVAVYRTHAL
jgi:hypothetical protein